MPSHVMASSSHVPEATSASNVPLASLGSVTIAPPQVSDVDDVERERTRTNANANARRPNCDDSRD